MSDQGPAAGANGAVVAGTRDAWTLTLQKAAWPIESALLILVTIIVVLAVPDRMGAWMRALAVLAGIVAAQGAVAFGGPAIKRAQESAVAVNGK